MRGQGMRTMGYMIAMNMPGTKTALCGANHPVMAVAVALRISQTAKRSEVARTVEQLGEDCWNNALIFNPRR
jgi:hypothetical protein